MPSTRFSMKHIATGLVALLSAWGSNAATELVVYYGQGSNQPRLSTFCQTTNIDVIPIGFVTKFANSGQGGVIETNFANQCYGPAAPGTNFVFDCPNLKVDIEACQAMGKKILLSIGGGAGTYHLDTAAEAFTAADDIWAAFGPDDGSWPHGRPFGDAVVDGFDLDLETGASLPGRDDIYAIFAQALRNKFATSPRTYMLTAAPQCPYPDSTVGKTITDVALDSIYVQYYNNPGCRPTRALSSDPATVSSQLSNFAEWEAAAASNAHGNTKWYLGLVASTSHPDYVNQADLTKLLEYLQPLPNFGGVMLWEATSASLIQNNDGVNYIDMVKHNLQGMPDPDPTTTTAATTTTSMPFAVTATVAPGETHLDIDSNCNQWRLLEAGQGCYDLIQLSGGTITQAQLESWNEAACDRFWANTWVCVGVSDGTATTTTTTTTTSAYVTTFPEPPSQTQPGVSSDCNLWHLVTSGEYCGLIVDRVGNGVTVEDIVRWNPAVGATCNNLWLNYYACVGVSGASTTTTTTTSTTASTTASSTTSSTTTTSSDTTTSSTTATSSDTTTSSSTTTTTSSDITTTTSSGTTSTTSSDTTSSDTTTTTGGSSTTTTTTGGSSTTSSTASSHTSSNSPTTSSNTTTHPPTTTSTLARISTTRASSGDPSIYAAPKTTGHASSYTSKSTTKSCTTTLKTTAKTTARYAAPHTTPNVYAQAYAKTTTKKTTTTTKKSATTTTTKPCTKKYRRAVETGYAPTYTPTYTHDNTTTPQNTSSPVPPPVYADNAQALSLSLLSVAISVGLAALLQAL